jgi:hypothetical protein
MSTSVMAATPSGPRSRPLPRAHGQGQSGSPP